MSDTSTSAQVQQAAPHAVASAELGVAARLDAWSERINPIVVKEVRQALRGVQFRRGYMLVLLVAAVFGSAVLISGYYNRSSASLGPTLFNVLYLCLCSGLVGLLPILSFQSIGIENEEQTIDLLVLSGLSPKQIVNGKLISIGVQALLLLSAFLPLMTLAYLLRGIDLAAQVVAIAMAVLISGSLACLAAGISANTHKRMARVLGLGVVAMGSIGSVAALGNFNAFVLMRDVDLLRNSDSLWGLGVILTLLCLAGYFGLAYARAAFVHVEDDAARGPRIASMVAVVALLIWTAIVVSVPGLRRQVPFIQLTIGSLLLYPLLLAQVTEREALGRRLSSDLRQGARRFNLLLPGGARAFAFLVVLSMAILAANWVAATVTGATGDDASRAPVALGYVLFYLGVPSALLSGTTNSASGRFRARVLTATFASACIILPMLFGALTGDRDLAEGRHWLNFIWAIREPSFGEASSMTLGLTAFLANVPRMMRASQLVRGAKSKRSAGDPETDDTRGVHEVE